MNKYIIPILMSCLALCGCKGVMIIDYGYTANFNIVNNSSHNIHAQSLESYRNALDATIAQGETYRLVISGNSPLYSYALVEFGCKVVFDNEIEVNHYGPNWNIPGGIKEHSICDDNSYESSVSGKHNTRFAYTYTFTDEDYDRAVAANAKSGGQIE